MTHTRHARSIAALAALLGVVAPAGAEPCCLPSGACVQLDPTPCRDQLGWMSPPGGPCTPCGNDVYLWWTAFPFVGGSAFPNQNQILTYAITQFAPRVVRAEGSTGGGVIPSGQTFGSAVAEVTPTTARIRGGASASLQDPPTQPANAFAFASVSFSVLRPLVVSFSGGEPAALQFYTGTFPAVRNARRIGRVCLPGAYTVRSNGAISIPPGQPAGQYSSPTAHDITMTFAPAATPVDVDASGARTPTDIFTFLDAYFSDAGADWNNDGASTAADIFDYLTAYFSA